MKTIVVLSALLFACGGTVVDIDGGADSGNDGGCTDCFDAGNPDSGPGPFSCGKSLCSGNEICIHGCCGGAMICAALDDGGTCPSGLTLSQQCPPEMPCTNECTPPEPYCGTVKDCSMPQGHDCYLLCQ